MDTRKVEKIAALFVGTVIVFLSLFYSNWRAVGIYCGCGLHGRLLYPFFHVNVIHGALNVWCLLCIVFYYDVRIWRILLAYIIAVSIPIDTLGSLVGGLDVPTVGLSGVIFALFGQLSFEVRRKLYYQAWMLVYLSVGFIFPSSNGWIHLYCYAAGFALALLNKPFKVER